MSVTYLLNLFANLKNMKTIIIKFIKLFVKTLKRITFGKFIIDKILLFSIENTRKIEHNGFSLSFHVPNRLNEYRVLSFSDKEPETLKWIDSIPVGSVIWDIGANVGLYSIYAAVSRNCNVFSFEPSVFNIELLARNIFLNKMTNKITIIPLPLSDSLKINHMRMTTTEWGGALSTFEKNIGWDGKLIEQVFDFKTIGISLTNARDLFSLPNPDYIKMDVDGIEHIILSGGVEILKSIKGILIEINDNFQEQAEVCERILIECGLQLVDKLHSDVYDSVDSFGNGMVWNQIWERK